MLIFYYASEYSHFLTRELGWSWRKTAEISKYIESEISSSVHILCAGQNLDELLLVQSLPPKSIWVLLYADEVLNPRLNRKVISSPAVLGVIRHYPCTTNNFKERLINTLQSIKLNKIPPAFYFDIYFYISLIYGYILASRKNQITKWHNKFAKSNVNLHLGYTNLFAQSVDAFLAQRLKSNYINSNSLLKNSSEIFKNTLKEYKFCFVGQRGKFWRQRALSLFEFWNESTTNGKIYLQIREKFGGTIGSNGASLSTGFEYTKVIIDSHFSLCPPGNFSNYTFRILESVVSGTIPIICQPCPTDPFGVNQVISSSIPVFGDWFSALAFMDEVSQFGVIRFDYQQNLVSAFERHFREVNSLLLKQQKN